MEGITRRKGGWFKPPALLVNSNYHRTWHFRFSQTTVTSRSYQGSGLLRALSGILWVFGKHAHPTPKASVELRASVLSGNLKSGRGRIECAPRCKSRFFSTSLSATDIESRLSPGNLPLGSQFLEAMPRHRPHELQ